MNADRASRGSWVEVTVDELTAREEMTVSLGLRKMASYELVPWMAITVRDGNEPMGLAANIFVTRKPLKDNGA